MNCRGGAIRALNFAASLDPFGEAARIVAHVFVAEFLQPRRGFLARVSSELGAVEREIGLKIRQNLLSTRIDICQRQIQRPRNVAFDPGLLWQYVHNGKRPIAKPPSQLLALDYVAVVVGFNRHTNRIISMSGLRRWGTTSSQNLTEVSSALEQFFQPVRHGAAELHRRAGKRMLKLQLIRVQCQALDRVCPRPVFPIANDRMADRG